MASENASKENAGSKAKAKAAAASPAVAPALKKRRLPKFVRQNWAQKKRVGESWRKPRGIDNKLRISRGGFGFLPKIGFRTARSERDLHPSGLKEVLVRSMQDLNGLKNVAIRFSATLGKKKKALLVAEAKKLQLRILNE